MINKKLTLRAICKNNTRHCRDAGTIKQKSVATDTEYFTVPIKWHGFRKLGNACQFAWIWVTLPLNKNTKVFETRQSRACTNKLAAAALWWRQNHKKKRWNHSCLALREFTSAVIVWRWGRDESPGHYMANTERHTTVYSHGHLHIIKSC